MKKSFKKYFIPHEENDHKPHFLREKSVFALGAIAVLLLFASLLGSYIVRSSKFLAAIQSAFLVDLANEDRVVEGMGKLAMNDKLVFAAQLKANDMAEKSYFAHTSPEGVTPWHWFREAGYEYIYAGENLAVNFSRSEDVQKAWMNSPTHRANIMNNRYKEIGIATAEGLYKGKRTTFVVQMFGSPVPSRVETTPIQVSGSVATSGVPANVVAVNLVPEVEGESTVATNLPEPEQTVVAQAQTSSPESSVAGSEDTTVEIIEDDSTYTSQFERFIINPSKAVNKAYVILFALILLSLILKIFIAIKKQHPRNIAYGVLLLVLVLVFMYLNQSIFTIPDVASV